MIGLDDVYKVVSAMAPLYFALFLGYGSIKWWHIFTKEQCDVINRFVCYFTFPIFTLDFTSQLDPYNLNYRFIGADVIAKSLTVFVLAIWAKWSGHGSFRWFITNFSLCSLNNSLAMGVPIMDAMYGSVGTDLVVQSFMVQTLVWMKILILVLEIYSFNTIVVSPSENVEETKIEIEESAATQSNETENPIATHITACEGNMIVELQERQEKEIVVEENRVVPANTSKPSFLKLVKIFSLKLILHPTTYPCIIGIVWALISKRWNVGMPSIVKGCIKILSTSGTGTSMFSLGVFMATQEKKIACGIKLTCLGLILRFIAGPAVMAIGALATGLRGTALSMTILQAALPQAISSFVYAKDYGLHASVLSTAVIIGTIVSLPVLIAYYAVAESLY
ncbi:Membrane transport protein [Dillenia turbinata]|uniref:Auxin efflux carrier component n=1 Tax=Dillenia turbinata TaxID=194707 RepID=A0AAN8YU22_9MAGN